MRVESGATKKDLEYNSQSVTSEWNETRDFGGRVYRHGVGISLRALTTFAFAAGWVRGNLLL
jgi:hypothetical protein